jgi:hypothetical protein
MYVEKKMHKKQFMQEKQSLPGKIFKKKNGRVISIPNGKQK